MAARTEQAPEGEPGIREENSSLHCVHKARCKNQRQEPDIVQRAQCLQSHREQS